MPKNKYTKKIDELEKSAQFDVDVRPVNMRYVKEMEADKFKYKRKGIFYKIYTFLVRTILMIFGPIVTAFYFDLHIKGRKNLKKIRGKGAIIVSNHVHLLDSLYTRQIHPLRQMYYLAAPFNNKKGLAGLTLRVAGVLPLATGFQLAKELDKVIADLLKRKKLLTIFAEESMWLGYTKIRPLKNGAFHFAVKNDVPVVPVVALFREPNNFDKIFHRKYKVTLKILEPIFKPETQNRKETINIMRKNCHDAMVNCATEFYGYDCDATHYTEQIDEKVTLIEDEPLDVSSLEE